jgi:MFS family permease
VIGGVGPGFVMSTLGHVLQSQLGSSVEILGFGFGVASFTGALLAVRFALDIVGAPLVGALSDRFELRSAATSLFALGAVSLAVAASVPGIETLIPALMAFFLCATGLTAAVAGMAATRGSEVYSRYVTAADVGAAAGPLLGWTAMEVVASPVLGLALGAGFYAGGAAISAGFLRREARVAAP